MRLSRAGLNCRRLELSSAERAGVGRVTTAKAICAMLLTGLLAACASLPEAKVSGVLKPGGFAFADAGGVEQGPVQALVAQRLSDKGLTPAPAASADYIVYLGLSDLPVKAGVYLPDAKTPQAPPGEWLADPRHGKKLHLQIVVLERAGGKTVFDGGATLAGRGRNSKKALPELVDFALGVAPGPKP
jgi:hypothetical protein